MLVGKDTVDNKTQLAKALFKLVKLFWIPGVQFNVCNE
jgi:hypothetical protein